MVDITVRGEHRTTHPPERANVSVSAAAQAAKADVAVSRVKRAATAVRSAVEEVAGEGGSVVRWSSDSVRTWSERPWHQDQHQDRKPTTVHHAQQSFECEFAGLDAVADWLTGVLDVADVAVEGVSWELTSQTRRRVVREAQEAAVHDARDRAQTYADALGSGQVTALAIADTGMLADGGPVAVAGAPARFALASRSAPGEGVDLRPKDIEVVVEVDCRFTA